MEDRHSGVFHGKVRQDGEIIMEVYEFIKKFTDKPLLKEEKVSCKSNNFYLINPLQKSLISSFHERPFSMGVFLGTASKPIFIPSFQLLDILLANTEKKVILKLRSSWLFVCGRDILIKGISDYSPDLKPGDLVLLESPNGECLGFGEWKGEKNLAVRHILDRGDFLRREKKRKLKSISPS